MVGIGEVWRVEVHALGVLVTEDVVGDEVVLLAHVIQAVVGVVGLAG